MHRLSPAIVLVAVALLAVSSAAFAESAQEAAARGKTLLAQGKVEEALGAYAAAAKADRANPDYARQFAMLRQVSDMRSRFAAEKDPRRWEYFARALRSFYLGEGLLNDALAIDKELHARLKTAETALMLAETQLLLKQNAEAVKTLESLPPGQATVATRALLGVALTRDGRADDAKKLAAEVAVPAQAGPGVSYNVARYLAATGDGAKAMATLKACFESVPPSRLEALKNHARGCPEFAAMAGQSDFATVMATVSRVPESKCSGGSSCAGCPMSSQCPKSKGKAQ